MGIYVRKDSPYYWMTIETTGEQRSTKIHVDAYTADQRKAQKESAEDYYRAHMTDLARGKVGLPAKLEPTSLTFETFAKWYDSTIIATHKGFDRERDILALLVKRFGPRELHTLTKADAQEYQAWRLAAKKPAAPRTINRELALLKRMLVTAVDLKHIKTSPLAGMPLLRSGKAAKRILTAPEEHRLLEQLRLPDRVLYIVAVDTLARLSNVLSLTRGEDRGTHLSLTDSKTGPYTVPLSTRARAALDAIPDTGPYYFQHRRLAKNPRDWRAGVRRMLIGACKRAHIPYGRAVTGITWHTATRASGATRMLRAQVDAKTVQTIGNWASFEQMGEYLQAAEAEGQLEAVNRIGAAFTLDLRDESVYQKDAKSRKKRPTSDP